MKKLQLTLASLSLLAVFLVPGLASADVNDFTVSSFKADETLSRADPQGELRIVEHIDVHFTDQNHGIVRAIPKSYKHHSLKIKINRVSSDSGAPAQYTTYSSNGNEVLKIGDPDRTVSGDQKYTIDYTVHNVITFYKDHDELYWDVNGDQWQQAFNQVSVRLNLPEGLNQPRAPICYAGAYGSRDQACAASNQGQSITANTIRPLYSAETLTYVASFGKGYFQPYSWYSSDVTWNVLKVGLLPLVTLLVCLIIWLKSGRDAAGRRTIVPQYDAPDGLIPLEVGTLLDFKADNGDITATIVDLAVRHYIKIIESKDKRVMRKDVVTYQLELVNNDSSDLKPQESQLLRNLFTQQRVGEQVTLDKAKSSLYSVSKTIIQETYDKLTAAGYFNPSPLKAAGWMYALALVLLIVVLGFATAFGVLLLVGAVLTMLILFFFGQAMPARTVKGVEALEHIKGLKMYLEVAEKDRIEKLQSPDAPYAANAGEPVKTVELFEKLLPYAMVLGVENQWAGKFKDLYTTPPDWYSGNWTTFNAVYLASSLNGGIASAVNTSFTSPSSSGGSGFGGGGFSGGGGGGGGGGGW
jgi:uncharacterized membrane protein